MAIAVVQIGTGGNNGANTVAATLAAAPTAGSLLAAFVAYRTVTSVTVTATGWSAQTATANGTVGGHRILTRVADGTEGTALSFDLAASVKAAVVVAELSGASGTLKSVNAGAVNSAAIAAHTGSAVTPAAADYLLFFDQNTTSDAAVVSSNASAVPTTGWTRDSTGSSSGGNATTRNRAALSYITGRSVSTTPSNTWSATVTGTKQQLLVQPAFLPDAPTVGAWSNPAPTSLTANWTAPATDSTHDAPTSYTLDYSTSATFASGVTTITGIDGGATSANVTGLASSTTYYFRVRAVNGTGTSANSAGSAAGTTGVAPAPYALAVKSLPGLALYWQLDETTGTIFTDSAAGNYPGTMAGAGYTLGAPTALASQGTAVAFSGGSAQIGASNAATPILNGSLSLSVWVKLAAAAPANHGHIAGFRDASDFYIVQLAGGTTLEVRFRPSNGVQTDFTPAISAGVWHHLVMVWDQVAGTYRLYIDNTLFATTSGLSGSFTDSTQPFTVGGHFTNYLNGSVDEVALYNVALTAAQVDTLYTGVAPSTGAILAATGAALATGAATALRQTAALAVTGTAQATGTATRVIQSQPLAATASGTATGTAAFASVGATLAATSTATATGTADRLALAQSLAATGSAQATGAGGTLRQTQPLAATGTATATGTAALTAGGGAVLAATGTAQATGAATALRQTQPLAGAGAAAATGTASGLRLVAVLNATGIATTTGAAARLALDHALSGAGVAAATGAALRLLQSQPLAGFAIGIGTGGATALVQTQPLAATGPGAATGTAAIVTAPLVTILRARAGGAAGIMVASGGAGIRVAAGGGGIRIRTGGSRG